MKEIESFSTYLLGKEAERRGIDVEVSPMDNKNIFLKLKYKGKTEVITGQRISTLTYNAHLICKKKQLTRDFLNDNNVKTPQGKIFNKDEVDEALEYAKGIKYPIVVKESEGSWGRNVYVNVKNEEEAIKYIKKVSETKNNFLVEEFYKGTEYRVLATRNKLLGVINRIPANVVGDGEKTIQELIDEKNSDPRRGEKHEKSLVKIKIDDELLNNLSQKELKPESIPAKDEQIFLRKNSNLSMGGDSIDVTDSIHPRIKEIASRVIRSIPGLPFAGFDFMTVDITKDPEEVGYAVIEINDSPMLSMHHVPYQGRERNVAKEIINLIFN